MIKKNIELNYDLYTTGLIFIAVFFQFLRWDLFPMFIDIYYHLSVMQGFASSGGYVTSSFWEFAPIGRPHLYPPLIHILMLILFKAGIGKIIIAKIFTFFMYPFTLFSIWLFARKLFNSRVAFLSVLLAASSFYFYLETSNIIAFSFALALSLICLVTFLKRKILTSGILLGLVFYTHTIIGWLLFLTILINLILNKKLFPSVKVLTLGMLLYLPFLVHQINNISFFRLVDVKAMHYIEINLFVYLFSAYGVFLLLTRKVKADKIFISFLISLALLILIFPQRIFSGSAMIGLIFLGAVALDRVSIKAKNYTWIFVLIIFILTYIISPTVSFSRGKASVTGFNSAFVNFLPKINKSIRANETNIYSPEFVDPLVKIIEQNSSKDDIICSNFKYTAGMLSVLSGRPTSSAMLLEVRPYRDFDVISASRLIIWLKELDGSFPNGLKEIIAKYNLKEVGATDIAYVYENDLCSAKEIVAKPIVNFTYILLILAVLAGLILFDNIKIR